MPTVAINTIATVFMFAFIPAAPLTMYLLHRGPRPAMLLAAAMILLGNWLRYIGSYTTPRAPAGSSSFAAVVVGQMLCGLAQPLVLAAPTRYSEIWFSSESRVAATAVASLANPFGAALGQLVNPFLVNGQPENISRLVLFVAVLATVCTLPTAFIPSSPVQNLAAASALSTGRTDPVPRPALLKSLGVALSSLEVWLVLVPFAVHVGLFNALSSVLNQIMVPHGFSDDEAGIGGAILIVVGLVSSAILSPIFDRSKKFLLAIKVLVPTVALSYLTFIWMPKTGSVVGPYFVLAVLGASSFSLLPVALEYLCDLSHPASAEVTTTLAWTGGQAFGGIFIYVSDSLTAKKNEGSPPGNMDRALILYAVLALLVMPLPLMLGLFGRQEKVLVKRGIVN